jgi:Uma2 family endonuclease
MPSDEDDFVQVVPDFVGEVRSSSDRLPKLKHKMTNTWMANGVRLAWLIDPYEEKAYVYRQGQAVEELSGFDDAFLSGEDILPGFMLDLREMKRGE